MTTLETQIAVDLKRHSYLLQGDQANAAKSLTSQWNSCKEYAKPSKKKKGKRKEKVVRKKRAVYNFCYFAVAAVEINRNIFLEEMSGRDLHLF